MTTEYATLAGGCFWCTEAVYNDVVGVTNVESDTRTEALDDFG